MQITELQTARTILRPFTEDDAIQSFSWFGDPEVMKFTPHGPDINLESTILRITHYIEHQNQYGYAKWIILDRNTMKPIGDSGPMYFPECHSFELGYRLLPSFWNQGIATEVTSAWIRYYFQILELKYLMAFTHTKNLASIRVLEKTGFQFSHQERLMGMDSMVFNIASVDAEANT
ncbi:GNAT family N-acetyltransferase [Methylomonas sp. AM2-LC]|uniref:GNAT family N-acetyltransferase n=1 Tax=Methylomonas sp. AM2-LC TaxID=3153301 RepID=UPI003264D420